MKRILSLMIALMLLGSACALAENAKLAEYMKPRSDIQNIIVMIPDGMSVGGITASRWFKAYDRETDSFDTRVSLALDEMASGHVRTYWQTSSVLGAITDSAPAGTALATGHKSHDKHIGVHGDQEKYPMATILEAARTLGKATGLIATSNIQHATPAAFSSHYFDRSRYDILGEQQVYQGMDVVLGAGAAFLKADNRKDGEDMIKALKDMSYQYITTRDELQALTAGPVYGMFADGAMAYEMDREATAATEPSLAEMTSKAIELLSQNENGFFLMVEGSKVDWAAHANDPMGVVSDILAFDEAVDVALNYAKRHNNTLILAMTDHNNGGITIGDRETDGSYSKDPVSRFILPLIKAKLTGEGIEKMLDAERSNIKEVLAKHYGIEDLTDEEVEEIKAAGAGSMNSAVGPMISMRANIGWTTGGHTGEEVTLYSYAPNNDRIWGTIDNTDIARVSAAVWGLDLDQLTARLFVNANVSFAAKGASVNVDKSDEHNPVLKVEKDGKVLLIPESKNYVFENGEKMELKSIIVQTNDSFYVPQEVIDLL